MSKLKDDEKIIGIDKTEGQKPTIEEQLRTERQNRALHKWFRDISIALNEAGLTPKVILEKLIDTECTEHFVKYSIWYTAQKAMFRKDSTTKLTTKEATEIEQVVKRFLNVECKIDVPFPTIESQFQDHEKNL